MTAADQHPLRLTPLPADEWDERAREALASLIPVERANPVGAGNVLSTLVRHPDLTASYLPFNAYLLTRSTLSPRVREVALLRVVHQSKCGYLWSHHLPIAARAGLSESEIDDIRSGRCADPTDQAVIRAVDDLTGDSTIGETTWDELCRLFTQQQCMDLIFTIGGYLLLALAVNTFGVQDEAR
ncbi:MULTISPECIES: carboxymuconolactone decarboxylase family protein [Mycobacterium]|uniref:carboxymuconolactone decarboxylase family protein n=1 Tax=Mycobacterium TaxID=1763 RepID=UPI001CD9368C|nr:MULTISPECIES: carboxymuconolactone decarboxylase family protein [Mycobacterium]MCA2240846.1 carboxymuconolactone decarboxylase family protein [Mycobacterium sp. WUMAC-067]MCA2313182.1 carboxymuconolactone decarboxylase family protein [Mycobacterium sp. WUMAC-025]MEE3750509.1 carboxymuconolactone decarboxylase family protein [Mycobacterium intracellulare]